MIFQHLPEQDLGGEADALDRVAGPAPAGTLVMVPLRAPHTFANVTDEPVILLNTFTPDLYVQYFRDLHDMITSGRPPTPGDAVGVMARYAHRPGHRLRVVAGAAAIPGAEFRLLPGAGHVPQVETPAQVLGAIRDFAAAHAVAGPGGS